MVGGPGPARVWSLLILDFVITLNLVLSDALTNDTSDRNCVFDCADFLVLFNFLFMLINIFVATKPN